MTNPYLEKAAELSLLDKYKASSGYKDEHAAGISGAVTASTFLGGTAYNAAKGAQKALHASADQAVQHGVGDAARIRHVQSLAGKLGRIAKPAGIAGAVLGIPAGYAGFKALAENRNKELDTKAATNPEFKRRLEQSPSHWLSHPATGATLGALGDVATGSPLLAAANFAAGAYEGIKGNEETDRRLGLAKKASVLSVAKSLAPKIAPTAGTSALKAQASSLKGAAFGLPSSKPPMAKLAEASPVVGALKYGLSALKGVGSLAKGGVKTFGNAFSGQEVRGIVAKHQGIPLYHDQNKGFLNQFKRGPKIDKLYEMSDDQMREAVKDNADALKSLNRAIDRRTGARVVTGAAGLAALAKINKPEEPTQNVYYR